MLYYAGAAVNVNDVIPITGIDIGALEFIPSFGVSSSAYTSFTFQVQDNGGTANSGVDTDPTPNTLTIDVTSVNDAPVGTDNTVTTLKDTPYVLTATDFGFTDPLEQSANSFQAVKLTTLPDNGTLTNNGSAVTAGDFISVSDIAAGLLVFTPASAATGAPYTSFTFQVQDNGGTANDGQNLDLTPRTMTVNVMDSAWVNHAPVGADNTVSTNENVAYAFSAADFGFTDPNDSPANAFLAVQITSLPTEGTLLDNGIAISAGDFVSVSHIAAGLLMFLPELNASGAAYAEFGFKVRDDGGTANSGANTDTTARAMTIDVANVNQSPAGADNIVTTLENAPHVFSTDDFGFSDANDSPGNTLQAVKITSLPMFGTLTNDGVPVEAGDLISASDIEAGHLVFTPESNASGAYYDSFWFQVQDDGGTTGGGSDIDPLPREMQIDVTWVNQAPAGEDNTVSINEDEAYALKAIDFGFSDPNDALANWFQAVKITSLPGAGTLTNDGAAVNAGDFISIEDIFAHKLVFAPAANGNGTAYTSLAFKVQDDGGTANGGADLDATARTLTFDVNPVNDAPTGADATLTMVQNSTYTFTTANFGFSDPIDGNSFLALIIQSLPAVGSLLLNGNAVSVNQVIAAHDIRNLTYTPPSNQYGTALASFTFKVQDDGGTENGGIDTDLIPRTITFDVLEE